MSKPTIDIKSDFSCYVEIEKFTIYLEVSPATENKPYVSYWRKDMPPDTSINMIEDNKMYKYYVYANGIYMGSINAKNKQTAMQELVNDYGTIDVDEENASTEGMEASLVKLYDHDEDWAR